MAGEVGADISYFQSFDAAHYQYSFIFIRATFGASMIDRAFAGFRAQARAKPIPYRAYYHFLVADVDAQTQFTFFESQVGDLEPGENVMIDDEDYGPTGGLPSLSMVQQFAALCFNRWGLWPIHYSLRGRMIANCPQTNASYTATNPGGDFWQYTDGQYNYTNMPASAGGIGSCDMNRCNGTLANYFLAEPNPDPVAAVSNQEDGMVSYVVGSQWCQCWVDPAGNLMQKVDTVQGLAGTNCLNSATGTGPGPADPSYVLDPDQALTCAVGLFGVAGRQDVAGIVRATGKAFHWWYDSDGAHLEVY